MLVLVFNSLFKTKGQTYFLKAHNTVTVTLFINVDLFDLHIKKTK